MNSNNDWNEFKRRALRGGAVIGWVISVIFSYIGFTANSHGGWFWKGLGICLSLIVTILELWTNGMKIEDLLTGKTTFGDLLLFAGGILSYVYDAWTNFLGLCVLMLGVEKVTLSVMSWSDIIIPAIAGIFLAALPEPMFVASMKKSKPVQENTPQQRQGNQSKPYNPKNVPPMNPHWVENKKPVAVAQKGGLVSPIFNDAYINRRYKGQK